MAGGSVTDPEKRYHLELATSHLPASREVQALMEEMGFLPRSIRRGADALLYFKQSEHIEDFLTKIGAPAAAMVHSPPRCRQPHRCCQRIWHVRGF